MSWLEKVIQWSQKFEKSFEEQKERSFHEFALDEFSKVDWCKDFELEKLISEFSIISENFKQLDSYSLFGDLPLTLFFSETSPFVLDLYVWTRTDTSIHDHAFEGCFQVLKGESIECLYDFQAHKSLGQCHFGELRHKEINFLKPGDTRPIKPKSGTIHKVVHFGTPSISLCLRTVDKVEQMSTSQTTYRFKTVASPSFVPNQIQTKLRILNWELENNIKPRPDFIQQIIHYGETWNILSDKKQDQKLLQKMISIHQLDRMTSEVINQNVFKYQFSKLDNPFARMLLIAYEFLGSAHWQAWIELHLSLSPSESFTILKNYLHKSQDTGFPIVALQASFLSEFYLEK